MQSELKPCDFCGNGDAPFVIFKDQAWVECGDCTSRVVVGPFNTEAEAIAAWNTRTSYAELTRLTEALRAAEEREKALRGNLNELASAEAEYRKAHDLHGDASRQSGRAWDLMRRAGDAARAALKEQPHD